MSDRIRNILSTCRARHCFRLMASCIFGLASLWAHAQGSQIEMVQAGKLEGGKGGPRYLLSTPSVPRVIFKRDNSTLYCNSAVQFPETKDVHAFGNVVIQEANGATVTADTLFYSSVSNMAEMRGRVVLIDKNTRVTTTRLFYNMETKEAYYLNKGKVEENQTILTSQKGFYRSYNKTIAFKGNVVLFDPKDQQTLKTDTMTYYTDSKDAYFHSRTEIISKSGKLIAQKGRYNTVTKVPVFEGNANIETVDYILKGENMLSDRANDQNIVKGNVELFSKKEFVTVYGDEMRYREQYGNSKVFGYNNNLALMKRPFGGSADTLLLSADTLFTVNDTVNNIRRLHAYHHVKLFSNDIQGACDSLVYDYNDSTITFFQNPFLWNETAQIRAEKIVAYLSNNNIDSMRLFNKAFIVQRDSLMLHSQIKGRNMVAYFKKAQLSRLSVDGNCQTLYFVTEADTVLIGMNKIDCGGMLMYFNDSSQLERMAFRTKPEARFVPLHELKEPETRLPDFRLRFNERPTKAMLVSRKKTEIPKLPNEPTAIPPRYFEALEKIERAKEAAKKQVSN